MKSSRIATAATLLLWGGAAAAHPGHESASFFSGLAHPLGGADHLLAMPAVESGIAVSVLVLGLLIAFAARLPIAAAVPLLAVFALFHGYAHHAEMGQSSLAVYAVGFALATAALHGAGYALGRWVPQSLRAQRLQRVAGVLIAGTGAAFLGA